MPILTTGAGESFTGNLALTGTLTVRVGAFDYVIVGGGGGGGGRGWNGGNPDKGGGGGGGGGVTTGTFELNATSYTVTVGAGGAGNSGNDNGINGSAGGASSIATVGSANGGLGGFGGHLPAVWIKVMVETRARQRHMPAVMAVPSLVMAAAVGAVRPRVEAHPPAPTEVAALAATVYQ